jgi:hypothetical protein
MRLLSQWTRNIFPALLLLLLCLFPLFGYLTRTYLGEKPSIFLGILSMVLLVGVLFEKYQSGNTLKIPLYVLLFGGFALYALVSGVLVSDRVAEIGLIKYLFKDPLIRCFVIFLLIENLNFSPTLVKVSIKVLFGMLILAAVVSIIQISDPFFFLNKSILVESNVSSSEHFLSYYLNNPGETTGSVRRLLGGYRFSIYSWITNISVGIDGMAIFSLLFGLKLWSTRKWVAVWLASAFVSFLSSSRWIMLNFVIISFQRALSGKQTVFKFLKYSVLICAMVVLTIYGARLLGIDMDRFIHNRLMASSFNSRFYAFEIFFRLFPESPILGTGGADTAEMIRLTVLKGTSTIHVGWLLLFFYYGLAGGIIYLGFVLALLSDLRQRATQTAYWGSFFAFVAFFVANLTLPAIEPSFYGLFLAIIFSKSIDNISPDISPKNKTIARSEPAENQVSQKVAQNW